MGRILGEVLTPSALPLAYAQAYSLEYACLCVFNEGSKMTPHQAQVWSRYHKAAEMLADATDELRQATQRRRDGLIPNIARYEQVAIGAMAEYRAARAGIESL